jgi:hypothetical protein
MSDSDVAPGDQPPVINYVIGFLLVGVAWGLTTPFIRRAAKNHNPPEHPILESDAVKGSWLKSKLYGAFFGVVDLLRNPRYAAPLLINLTGSVWFFLLIGKAGEFWCAADWTRPVLISGRTELDCAYCEHPRFPLHCAGRVVGGEEGHQQR